MPNSLGPTGLQLKTRDEIITELRASLVAIYGADINTDSDSPDGQWIGIIAQASVDLQDLLAQIYNSFDPDNAVGVVLDQRVAINGIQRQAGTFTITPITIMTSAPCNLFGLDQTDEPPYTVQDNAGNRWLLLNTTSIGSATTTVLNFRAEFAGAVLTVPNTITTPVSIVLGVSSVNNPTVFTSLGLNEESDAALKIRRQRSVSLASQGYLAGLIAALENINGLTSVFVYENNTSSADPDGVPGHSIWVIVAGTAPNDEIADAIYTKRNAGCGMRGDVTFEVTQVDGSPFIVRWDTVLSEALFVFFSATSIDGVNVPDVALIREGLPTSFVPGVNQEININTLATRVQEIDPNTLVTNAGFSDGRLQTFDLSGVPASGAFKFRYNGNDSAAIDWDDAIGVIQSALQAVPGLGSATVTGSLAGQQIEIDLSAIPTVLSLVTIVDNSIETSTAAPVQFVLDPNVSTTLSPQSKRYQFTLAAENIVIAPVQLLPSVATVLTTGTRQLNAFGGYGDYTYSMAVNNTGGNINSDGLYTAGASPGVDTVRATDELGNYADSVITAT